MEVLFWFLMVVFVAGGIYAADAHAKAVKRDCNANLEGVIRAQGGSLRGNEGTHGAVSDIWVKPMNRCSVSAFYHSSGGRNPVKSTRFMLRVFGGKALRRLEIYTQTPVHEIAKFFGMQDIEVGDRVFDDAFILKANDEPWLRSFLTSNVRGLILEVANRTIAPIYFSTYGDTAELRQDTWLYGDDLERFVSVAMQLAQALHPDMDVALEPGDLEIELVSVPLPSTAACLVCGDGLPKRPVVRCGRCETPHHLECWTYNGNCAVYGCTEKKYRKTNS